MAEGARLESVFTVTGNVGSNPTLSATRSLPGIPHGYLQGRLRDLGKFIDYVCRRAAQRLLLARVNFVCQRFRTEVINRHINEHPIGSNLPARKL